MCAHNCVCTNEYIRKYVRECLATRKYVRECLATRGSYPEREQRPEREEDGRITSFAAHRILM